MTSTKTKLKKFTRKEESLYEQNKHLYRIEYNTYKSGSKIELSKKNLKYGYFNFITYLENDDEETIKKEIIKNLKESKNKKK